MKRQLSFALSLSSLISATAMAVTPASTAPLLNPEATCASYEKLEQACAAQAERLEKLASKTKFQLLDKDIEPALKAASDAIGVFEGCTMYYAKQIEAGKSVTQDVKALAAAEDNCMQLAIFNFGMHPETLKTTVPLREELRKAYYVQRVFAAKMLEIKSKQPATDKVEAKEAAEASEEIEEDNKKIEQKMVDEDPKLAHGADAYRGKNPSDKSKGKGLKVPGVNSLGDAVKTALGLGTLGAGLGMGISDFMNLAKNNSLAPLVNPVGVAAGAATADTSVEAASGGGVGSSNPSQADSRIVPLTAEVTVYGDGRRVVNGDTIGKLKSSSGAGAADEARGDNSGRSSNDTSASSTLSSQSNTTQQSLASGQTRSAVRTLSSDSARQQKYIDEQEPNEAAVEAQRHQQAK